MSNQSGGGLGRDLGSFLLTSLTRLAASTHKGATNEGGFAHGDFAPWNLLRADDAWVAVDWESSEQEAPPFYDLFHFLSASLRAPGSTPPVSGLAGSSEAEGEWRR